MKVLWRRYRDVSTQGFQRLSLIEGEDDSDDDVDLLADVGGVDSGDEEAEDVDVGSGELGSDS